MADGYIDNVNYSIYLRIHLLYMYYKNGRF